MKQPLITNIIFLHGDECDQTILKSVAKFVIYVMAVLLLECVKCITVEKKC